MGGAVSTVADSGGIVVVERSLASTGEISETGVILSTTVCSPDVKDMATRW